MLQSHIFADVLVALLLSLTLAGAVGAVSSEHSVTNPTSTLNAEPATAESPAVSAR